MSYITGVGLTAYGKHGPDKDEPPIEETPVTEPIGNEAIAPPLPVEEPIEEVADEAETFVFHPKQTVERLPDGSLMVRFRAGGRQEMAWYLARWEGKVEVRRSVD